MTRKGLEWTRGGLMLNPALLGESQLAADFEWTRDRNSFQLPPRLESKRSFRPADGLPGTPNKPLHSCLWTEWAVWAGQLIWPLLLKYLHLVLLKWIISAPMWKWPDDGEPSLITGLIGWSPKWSTAGNVKCTRKWVMQSSKFIR